LIAAASGKHPCDLKESLTAVLLHCTNRGVEPEGVLVVPRPAKLLSDFLLSKTLSGQGDKLFKNITITE
jgi:hypothetical protein